MAEIVRSGVLWRVVARTLGRMLPRVRPIGGLRGPRQCGVLSTPPRINAHTRCVGQPGRLVFLNAMYHTALRVTTVEPRDASRSDAEVRPLPDPAVTADDLPKHHSRAPHTKFFAYQESLITN
ncbi:hypothetical protein [Streptomyces avermitilis]|uniref:Uncharacterized protein n=2 Tax=Streptomyces avermitilis TaxID=33903 RepID=A0A143T2I2_STRAW|nr:hypothetical protein [Streptomyces avermitilis]BAU77632.1 hypothetical protein SAVERM_2p189 [Streptomyces avermitilis MA-4680 = NBRC 14893]GDY70301.1 hypothetical protein SAV14893_096940 [Streptomyces avermitilis]GDY80609.1 hypothetical protein SAV31267_100940 [Streptomyces avermitilis]